MTPEKDKVQLSPLPTAEEKARALQYARPEQLNYEVYRRHAESSYRYDHHIPFISLNAIAADLTRRAEFFAKEHEKFPERNHNIAARQLAAAAANCRLAQKALGLETPAEAKPEPAASEAPE